jgi:hypothetical protein
LKTNIKISYMDIWDGWRERDNERSGGRREVNVEGKG